MKNKKKIVISIKPEYVSRIINGLKRFEYRKIAAKSDISSIIIYETTPIKKIVAEAEIIEVLSASPEKLWEMTKEFSGVSKTFFDKYFYGKKIAYAYKLGKIKVYDRPFELCELGIKNAPQSFIYY